MPNAYGRITLGISVTPKELVQLASDPPPQDLIDQYIRVLIYQAKRKLEWELDRESLFLDFEEARKPQPKALPKPNEIEQLKLQKFYNKDIPPLSPQGTIYFLRAEHIVKIGHTFGGGRKTELQVGNPTELKVMRMIPGSRKQEKWLHKQFAALHIRGEWFNFCEEMLTIVPPSISDL